MTPLKILYYYFIENDLYDEIKKAERKLFKLKSRVMNGDKAAARLAWDRLSEYDLMKVEYEKRHLFTNDFLDVFIVAGAVANELKRK